MKAVKPQRLGLLYRSFEHEGECFLVSTLFAFFPFEAPSQLLPEVSLWKLVARELGKSGVLDMGMSKQNAELLVTGKCFTKGGEPRPACSVRVTLGAIDKTVYVVGDRQWGFGGASEPEPFTEMPIGWENAFGGEGYAPNPLGKGYGPVKTEKGETRPLPNVEDPKHLVKHPKDRPSPAGLGAYYVMWPQRFSKVGTYDLEWAKERAPGFARDMDWGFFSTAAKDQQLEGYLRGDETFRVENMHPDAPIQSSALPGVKARCFITQKTEAGEVFREIPMRVDTVHLFPNAERGLVIFRGVTKVAEDDAADVLHLLAACETMGEPKPEAHYRAVLATRLDRTKAHLAVLSDRDLMPAPSGEAKKSYEDPDLEALSKLLVTDGLLQKNLRNKAEAELEKAREQVRAAGLDPDEHVPPLPPPEPPPNLDELPGVIDVLLADAEQKKKDAEAERKKAEEGARKACEAQGLDYDELVRKGSEEAGGPPKFSAAAEMQRLRDLSILAKNAGTTVPGIDEKLADPTYEKRLIAAEKQLREAYRLSAHYGPAAGRREGPEAQALRDELLRGKASGASFAERDFTGLDLSNMDLSGVDLHKAMMERADLSGCDLRGANLDDAVLTRADLSGATLAGASVRNANLGQSKNVGADYAGANLTGAIFYEANLAQAGLSKADLTGADLTGATFEETDFAGVTAPRLRVFSTNLSGLSCKGADLQHAVFIDCTLSGVDFTGAQLTSATFVECKGDGASFRGAVLNNLRVVKGSSFQDASFKDAKMKGANLRGTSLARSDFSGALMPTADFSEADLREADFTAAVAPDAMFIKSDLRGAKMASIDLMQGLLQKAKLHGADLSGANLFRVDFAKVEADEHTAFDDANLKQIRVVARGAHGPG